MQSVKTKVYDFSITVHIGHDPIDQTDCSRAPSKMMLITEVALGGYGEISLKSINGSL